MNQPLNLEQLRGFTPLNALSASQWRQLRSQLVAQPLLAGQLLLRRGDQAPVTYYLLAGELELSDEHSCERLLAGTAQACMALSPALPRQQNVRAVSDASVLAIDSAVLNHLLAQQLTYQDVLLAIGLEHDDQHWLEPLLDNPLFTKVPASNIHTLLERMQPFYFKAGTQILTEGERGDCCYFLQRGRVEVVRGTPGNTHVLAELSVGSCFGEEALLSDASRNATVTALEDCCVLRLGRQDFFALIKEPVVADVSFGEALRLREQGAQWLDVRLQQEYEHAHALQALHMPLQLLRLKARLLDSSRTYLCYCDTGKRSSSGAFLLAELGFRAYVLCGGLNALPALQREGLLSDSGAGYLMRSSGEIERSR